MRILTLQDIIGRNANGVKVVLLFQEAVDLGLGKRSVGPTVPLEVAFAVAHDDRLQYAPPIIGAMDLRVAQERPFQVAKLVAKSCFACY